MQGTQQSGLVPLRLANLATDGLILNEARVAAIEVLADDPGLEHSKNRAIKEDMVELAHTRPNWSKIS